MGGSKDERANPPESGRERHRERKRKSVWTKVFAVGLRQRISVLLSALFFPILFPPIRQRSSWSVEIPKGAQMRRLNKALDAHSKALLLILQVSAAPLWPVTCPEPCCFARLWVDLVQGIMHEFGQRHMCLRLNSIDEDARQSPNRAVRQTGENCGELGRVPCCVWAHLGSMANAVYSSLKIYSIM